MRIDTKAEWLAYFKANEKKLLGFIENWHPAASVNRGAGELEITASAPEAACQIVRASIISEEKYAPAIATRFAYFLAVEDCDGLYGLLNSSWFGVPESTGCWGIEGFKEAVNLLENPPEEEEEKK